MLNETQGWMQSLEDSDIIEKFDTGIGVYHRLTADTKLLIQAQVVKTLQEAYDPGLEKGGFLFARLEKREGENILTVTLVCFVQNVSDFPEGRYRMHREQFISAIQKAKDEKLFPLSFHTHPTKTENYLEPWLFLRQMDTSAPDKSASLFHLPWGDRKLRLPDVLVIGNNTNGRNIFIGLYGGLVAPLDFTDRKKELKRQLQEKVTNEIGDYLDNPKKQILAAVSALAAVCLLIKYPKAILPTTLVAGSLLPVIAYRSTSDNEHFAIANPLHSLEISLPKLDDAVIRENEKQLVEISEKLKQQQQSAAA